MNHIKGQLLIILSNFKYVMLQCNNILNDCWTFLKPFLYICILHCKDFGHLWYFYCFHFAVLCISINSELNANEIKVHTLYSATLVQLMFISFNTIYPE